MLHLIMLKHVSWIIVWIIYFNAGLPSAACESKNGTSCDECLKNVSVRKANFLLRVCVCVLENDLRWRKQAQLLLLDPACTC